MDLKADDINGLLKARSEIDEELRRHKAKLTVLFTDVVGSTGYFDRYGDTAGLLLLHRHDHLVITAVEEFQGRVIKTIGDSVMAEFPEPQLAVVAAIEIQRRLFEQNQKRAESERLHVRAGINAGVSFRRGSDLLGDAVNVASRLTKLSGPGQILVSRSVWEATLDSDIWYKPIGRTSLEGKAETEEIYEVIWTDSDVYEQLRTELGSVCARTLVDELMEASPVREKAPAAPPPQASVPRLQAAGLLPPRYEILSCLGEGGMGVVFKARDHETKEIVALKVLKQEIATSPTLMEAFRNELRVARKITHRNVCRIFDFTRTDEVAFISMEFVQGETLRQVLNRFGALGFRKGLKIADQMCDGLREAHAQGIVHRDLKPDNFMIDEAGNVKLMDFGLAHLVREKSTVAAGTPSYMAPEQTQGEPFDQRADIYSLGLVLFEIFTGSPAFRGDTPMLVALKQVQEQPPDPREIDDMLPEHVGAAILRCLEKDPEKRFQSVDALQAALRQHAKITSTYRLMWRALIKVAALAILTTGFVAGVLMFNRKTESEAEVAAFRLAQSVDTLDSWEQFLKTHHDGDLASAARDRVARVRLREVEKTKAAAAAEKAITPAPIVVPAETPRQTPPAAPPQQVAKEPPQQVAKESKTVEKEPREDWTALVDMARIPGGVFSMGNDAGRKDEKPAHQVRVNGFRMSRTEISNRQYRVFLEQTGHARPKDPSFAKRYLMDYPDLPVVNVSYQDALDFCAWFSRKYGVATRLPTEAEWEYAALGGKTADPLTSKSPKELARYRGNSPTGVQTVGKNAFPANGFGLYNMSGNVWEWVSDFYSKDYYQIAPLTNPSGPASGAKRVVRGGSWADDEIELWSYRRASRDPNDRSEQIGFRIVIDSPREPETRERK